MVAPAPERPIDGGMATEALIVHVVVSKFCDWPAAVPPVADAGAPRHDAGPIDAEQLGGPGLLVADAALRPDRSAPCCPRPSCSPTTRRCRCSIPVAAGPRPGVYGATRSTRGPGAAKAIRWPPISTPRIARVAHPAEHLASFKGVLQVDGYTGFKRLGGDRADASVCLAFCWAHMRRGFYDFHVSTKSPLAAEALRRIAALYDHRGRHPRHAGRAPPIGTPATKPVDGRGAARLADRAAWAHLRALPHWPRRYATPCATGTD